MNILLLTDVPPCKNFTAGIVLHDLCSMLPENSWSCYCVKHPNVDATLSPEFDGTPYKTTPKPIQSAYSTVSGFLGQAISYLVELYRSKITTKIIAKDIITFAKEQNATAIWCTLQGQTMIQLANEVRAGTDLPLYTTIWDPPGWWLRDNKVDKYSSKRYLGEFDKALKSSHCVMTASRSMSTYYTEHHGANCVNVVAGLDESLVKSPKTTLNDDQNIIITIAGQLYARKEIDTLVNLLNTLQWNIIGKKIILRMIGAHANLYSSHPCNIEYLGWYNQGELINKLAESDILYCPYWFSHEFSQEANLSFPSKVPRYMAAGRPILFHGPKNCSPAMYLSAQHAAVICDDPDIEILRTKLMSLIEDKDLLDDFTYKAMREQFANFIPLTST